MTSEQSGDRLVSVWLFALCFMVFGMVVGGGHARTIGAGFSIQEWRPFTGFIPPRSTADWQHLFGLYQQTAQYQAAHPAVTLAQFKSLFWPMFFDRLWGRIMALVLLIPLAVFWARRRISHRLALWVLALFAAGGAQAWFGWYMVETAMEPGVLNPLPSWLAPHFLSAMLIFAALLWTALSVRTPRPPQIPGAAWLRPWSSASVLLILLTMTLGALVAATNAVTVFNTFPTMDGRWIPQGFYKLSPAWLNFIANQATVQFDHRLVATLTALVVLATVILGLRAPLPPGLRDGFLVFAGLMVLQYLLGMVTVVLGSAELGFFHELNAVLLLAAAIIVRHGLRGATGAPIYSNSRIAAE